ncbi:MAG: NDP-sugar synthase, partial [Candidatus Bathyarchaeota archaeon]|nr:NDP-sugar synthase [Candidatus Bathyarchaeota archaeon]
ECGVVEVIIAANFKADLLERVLGRSKFGIRLHYSRDAPLNSDSTSSARKALGTGGPVKKAEDLLGRKESFFVLNGDILTNVDYSAIMSEHQSHDGTATLALCRVKDPSRYGAVELAEDGRVRSFIEKPSSGVPDSLVNAGIYVFKPTIFSYFPAAKRCSIEREIFPELAKGGELFGCEIQGVWVDIGTPLDLIRANQLWMKQVMNPIRRGNDAFGTNVEAKENVAIEKGVKIGEGSVIGPNVSLGRSVSIGRSVRIKNSIVFPCAEISDYSLVDSALIGASVSVGRGVSIESGCLIGDNATILDGVRLSRDARVCPSREVSEDMPESGCVL